jgi:hypothetical protein
MFGGAEVGDQIKLVDEVMILNDVFVEIERQGMMPSVRVDTPIYRKTQALIEKLGIDGGVSIAPETHQSGEKSGYIVLIGKHILSPDLEHAPSMS